MGPTHNIFEKWVPLTTIKIVQGPWKQGDQRGGTHTNEKLHVKFITIGCSNGPYERRKRSNLNPLRSVW